jgi:hypothetical protein
MANHCYNYATGSGSKENLTRLAKIVEIVAEQDTIIKNYVSCWSKIYPLFFPQEGGEEEEDSSDSYMDVYDDWGSKWFEGEFDIDPEGGSISIWGDSAWSPVLPFFSKLCKEYKLELEGYYDEPGMDFAGKFTIDSEGDIDEQQITSRQFRMEDNPEGFWSDVIEQIEEGCYETMEDILAEFDVDFWGKLTEEDVATLQKTFDFYKANNKDEDEESTK